MRTSRAAAALLLWLVVLAAAQVSPAAGEEPFGAGSGRATAKLVRVGPSRGALTLAPQVGLALADYLNTRGRGDVRTADFAALADSIPSEVSDELPDVKVESTDENAEAGETVTLGSPTEIPVTIGAARLHAEAGAAPYGASWFEAGAIDLGVGTISGARAASHTGVVDRGTREAVATVVIPRLELAEGAVVLENLMWRAVQRSGGEQVEEATFTIGAATVAGQAVAAPSGAELPVAEVAQTVAPVLTPLGIEVTFPTARIEGGAVALSPLRVRVSSSDAAPALIPVTDAIQPARDALVGAIRDGSDGQVDAAILLTDIAVGVVTGGSDLDIELGGVTASTSAPAARFEFSSVGGYDVAGTSSDDLTSGPSAARPSAGAAAPQSVDAPPPSVGAAPPVAVVPDSPGAPGLEAVALESLPASSTGRRGGPLLAVGLSGLVAAAASALADLHKLRVGRRVLPV